MVALSGAARRATVSDNQKAAMLQSISRALRTTAPSSLRAGPQPTASASLDLDALAQAFITEVEQLRGHASVVADKHACALAIADCLRSKGAATLAVHSAPLAADVAELIAGVELLDAQPMQPEQLESCTCSLLAAEALLADTGSALVLATSRGERALPYLARTCFIVATMERLQPSLNSAALSALYRAAQSETKGEAVIVTGPSRTADIEKTLILGAHGPEELHVYIMRDSSP
jgi:L-lactate dehydrogenase complex protein LldG